MAAITYKNAGKQEFMSVMQELVKTYQAFSLYDSIGLKRFELTVPQADVLFALGNTEGLTFKEIGELTLITKGTLTGVIDRLEKKLLVQRIPGSHDRRCTLVVLTSKGVALFRNTFPKHITYLKARFERLSKSDRDDLARLLRKLRAVF